MTKDKTKAIKGLLKNEIKSMEAALARLKNILEVLEAQEAGKLSISEAVDLFISERCVLDPAIWENYNLLYDDFELFKAEQGITTDILKRHFFAELAKRGHKQHPGPGFYEGEPRNSINGIYLKWRQPEIEREREELEAFHKDPEEVVREILQERGRAAQEEEDRLFNVIVDKAEEEEDPKKGGGLFNFKNNPV